MKECRSEQTIPSMNWIFLIHYMLYVSKKSLSLTPLLYVMIGTEHMVLTFSTGLRSDSLWFVFIPHVVVMFRALIILP